MKRLSKCVLAILAVAVVLASSVEAQPNKLLDINLAPNFGQVKLKTGFTPDPHTVNVVAGGDIKVVVGEVTSHVTKQPDFKLFFETDGRLPLTFYTTSKGDTTLIINLPNGKWIANDDGGKGLNAKIKINNPMSGRYDIYVGTFKPALESKVKLKISEVK